MFGANARGLRPGDAAVSQQTRRDQCCSVVNHRLKALARWSALLALTGLAPRGSAAAERTSFNVAWSIYVGWMPWDYADQQRHPEEMGRQVRHQDQAHPDQRLRRIDQPIHRRQLRRLRDDQHGHADDSGGGRRRFDGADRRRFLQRQRRRGAQGQGQDSSPTSRARRSIWSSCRCRTICWCARSAPWDCASATSRSSTPRTPTSSARSRTRDHRGGRPGSRS